MAPAARADVNVAGYGGTSDLRTGEHGDLTVGANFTYSDANEDLKRVIVDTPAGGVGNPNAVPYADRCSKTNFETAVCPPASQIGVVTLDIVVTIGVLQVPQALTGTISIIQTDPEVPTLVGAYISASDPLDPPTRAYARFYPVTSGPDGDFRIRSLTDDFPRTATIAGIPSPIRVDRYQQLLWGVLPSGVPFLTNPMRCETWLSYGYAEAYDTNTNANSDPLSSGANKFVKTDPVVTNPDCTTTPPFPIKASATISSDVRGESPSLTTTLEIPGLGLGDPAPDSPKTVVATLPKAINADILQLGRLCPLANIDNDACPANSKVGSVKVETPLIAAGLTGDAYLTEPSGASSLPDLVLKLRGAINFTARGVNRYVDTSRLQSTFDNLPQPGFSKFELTIDGGKDGLLKNLACPKNQDTPADGPISFSITGYTGQNVSVDAPVSWAGCYGITTIRRTKCAKHTLNVRAYYRSRSNVRKVRLYVSGRRARTSVHEPFTFKQSVLKYRRGRKKLTLRAFYKDGTVVKKNTYFRRC